MVTMSRGLALYYQAKEVAARNLQPFYLDKTLITTPRAKEYARLFNAMFLKNGRENRELHARK